MELLHGILEDYPSKAPSSTKNHAFGEIPRKPGTLAGRAAYVFIVIFIFYYGWKVISVQPEKVSIIFHTYYHYIFTLLILFWGAIIGKLIQCFCVFTEEFRHISSRHYNSYWQTIKSCFQVFFTKASAVGVCLLVIGVFFMRITYEKLFDHHVVHFLYWPTFISSVGVSLITNYVCGFKILSKVEVSEVQESSNTNIAQGLAWSYFTGYLKIVLPRLKETISKDPRWEREMEAENLPCKLFAIVPLNCKVPAKLGEDEVKHEGITFYSKLPTLYIDRAGVKDRPYVNSVYKIRNREGNHYYAICEYVTIIDTLFQMPFGDQINTETREEQCRLFVRTLEELIDKDNVCRCRCKIVTLSGEDMPLLRDVLIDKIQESRMDINF